MTMIDVKNLKFGYEGSSDYLFDGVSFRIDTDWKLGLVGRNGRGKTTLMRILRGELPYGGTISGLPKFISFPFDIDNEYELGGDVVRLNAPNAQDWEIRREMNYLELDEDILYRPYCLMSGGEKTKIQLISLFLDDAAFPLIDEPTNHLDRHGREVTAEYLKRKKGFILISHDRVFLDNSTDHTMAINKVDVEISQATFSTWWEQKEIKEKYESVQNERLKRDIARLNGAKEEARRWSDKSQSKIIGFDPRTTEKQTGRRAFESSKATKMARHMKSIEKRYDRNIEEKEGLLKNQETYQELKVTGQKHYKDLLVKVSNVVMSFDGSVVNEKVSFEINQGDVIALNGTNGSGKSTLLKLIAGQEVSNLTYEGDIYIAPNLKVSYVMQDTSKLRGNLRDYAFEIGVDETRFKSILRKMGLSKENLDQEISLLSEGQKKCVLIAGSLCHEPNLFIWDEPLNYIDIYIRKTIEDMLKEADITMIYVEHDRAFTEATSNKEAEILKCIDS